MSLSRGLLKIASSSWCFERVTVDTGLVLGLVEVEVGFSNSTVSCFSMEEYSFFISMEAYLEVALGTSWINLFSFFFLYGDSLAIEL